MRSTRVRRHARRRTVGPSTSPDLHDTQCTFAGTGRIESSGYNESNQCSSHTLPGHATTSHRHLPSLIDGTLLRTHSRPRPISRARTGFALFPTHRSA